MDTVIPITFLKLKKKNLRLLVDQESALQCKGHWFNSWSGNIPHAARQLSTCATTAEPKL